MAVVGGLIADKTIKYTKNDKVMAFLTLEDLVGNVEIVVFPRDYEKYAAVLLEDAKVFIRGRASVEEDKDGKVICEEVLTFEEVENAGGYSRGNYGNGSYGGQGGYGNNTYGSQGGYGNASQSRPKLPTGLWIQFADMDAYDAHKRELVDVLSGSTGEENVVVFLRSTKDVKVLPPNLRITVTEDLIARLGAIFGPDNVKLKR